MHFDSQAQGVRQKRCNPVFHGPELRSGAARWSLRGGRSRFRCMLGELRMNHRIFDETNTFGGRKIRLSLTGDGRGHLPLTVLRQGRDFKRDGLGAQRRVGTMVKGLAEEFVPAPRAVVCSHAFRNGRGLQRHRLGMENESEQSQCGSQMLLHIPTTTDAPRSSRVK